MNSDPRAGRFIVALIGLCALLVLSELFVNKHGPFALERTFGFYAVFGFVVCAGFAVVAKLARILLMRREDYYDR